MTLRSRLARFRRRLWLIGSASAVARGLAAAVVLLLAAVWLDLMWDLSPAARITVTAMAAGAACAVAVGAMVSTARAAGRRSLAQRIDRAGSLGGQVLTGLELEHRLASRRGESELPLSVGLSHLAVAKAAVAADAVAPSAAVPAGPLRRAATRLLLLGALVVLLVACLPELARTELDRFLAPHSDVPPYSPLSFRVEPGDAKVLYGSPLEIHAEVLGGEVEQVELVLSRADGAEEILPMFAETAGRWRTVLASVTVGGVYHVRAQRARSPRYRVDVVTVPRIEAVRVRVAPPSYTRQRPYEGPAPKDGIAALPGTEVTVWARSNRPLSGGTLAMELDARSAAAQGPDAASNLSSHVAMQPGADGADEVMGRFTVAGAGKLVVRVVDVEGQPSQEAFTTTVTLLKDHRPLIRILQPPPESLATPNVVLPVILSAEDDYGVSRVELYRSLNHSRPLPADAPVADPPPRRAEADVDLPLANYRLQPGDTIRLFARVEDNDPAGAKGAESTVATVRIISQEEFERLVQMRDGLDALVSKYREAQRRMEGLAEEMERLLAACQGESADAPMSESLRAEAERLLKRLREEAQALEELAGRDMPFDIDKALSDELKKLAECAGGMAKELEETLGQSELKPDALASQMEKLLRELADKRGQFQQAAMVPLETLEAFFPLAVDQSRFVMLVLRQMDLAERAAALKGRDGDDDPALRARMRDLQEEQRDIRESLDELLADIEQHVEQLPEDESLDTLRSTAKEFVAQVRASGAMAAMSEAENALAEFAGTLGHEKARLAAEILQEFLARPQDECLGEQACQAMLAFCPALGGSLGNSIPQLLGAMGLGSGWGSGAGSGGGFSAMRGGFGNMGLYGMLPGMGDAYQTGGTGQGRAAGADGVDGGPGSGGRSDANPDQPGWDGPTASGEAAGAGEAAAPLRYRRRVGEYFRRLAEELNTP